MLNQTKSKKEGSENPFYGCRPLLKLFQELPKLNTPTKNGVYQLLNDAFNSIASEKNIDKKQQLKDLFYVIIFKSGDIVNRQHTLFGKDKVDGGGDSMRKTFRYCLSFILENDPESFYKILPLIPEYTNFENIMFYQITTDRYKGTVKEIEKLGIDYDKLIVFLTIKLKNPKTPDFEIALIAKFLPGVPVSKRYKRTKDGELVSREKQKVTKTKDTEILTFIAKLSKAMNWDVVEKKRNLKYEGYCKFRSSFLALTEAHMFSTKKITGLDKVQFKEWLEALPAGARHRVQCRICEKQGERLIAKTKWISDHKFNLGSVYLEWLAEKEQALKLLLTLSDEDKKELGADKVNQLTKQAKINTGAETLFDTLTSFFQTNDATTLNLKANSILEKVKIEVPLFCILDRSGSMSSQQSINGLRVSARDVAILALSVFLAKNPNPELQNMFMTFGTDASVVVDGKNEVTTQGANRFTTGNRHVIDGLLFDKTKPFLDNYNVIRNIVTTWSEGGTRVNTIALRLKEWVDSAPQLSAMRVEQIQQHPVWLIISDGDMNNSYDATSSMSDLQMKLKQWFNYEPVIVVWDVKGPDYRTMANKFENLENVIYFGGFNYQILNQIFTNISDLDIIDVYTPLQAIMRSDRYTPVINALS